MLANDECAVKNGRARMSTALKVAMLVGARATVGCVVAREVETEEAAEVRRIGADIVLEDHFVLRGCDGYWGKEEARIGQNVARANDCAGVVHQILATCNPSVGAGQT